jgi:hypothetical protein
LRVIRLIRAIATLGAHAKEVVTARVPDAAAFKQLAPVLCRIGERAPPVAA